MGLLLCLSACVGPASDSIGERGLGGADGVFGSCVEACGEPSPEGNCWCDEACAEHGDCCADKVETCGGEAPEAPPSVLCESVQDCWSGFTCDTSACYSSCRDGEDCDEACLGICVEPSQQSLPTPKSDDPEPAPPQDEPSDDPGSDDALDPEVPECDCPEDADLCVPLCPVCPPDVPDEECQCTVVCVTL